MDHPFDSDDLEERLAAARAPIGARAMPRAPWRIQLKTAVPLRRLLPTRAVVSLAAARAQRRWRQSPGEREDAIAMMQAIVGSTPRAGEATELARRHAIEDAKVKALFWQPWKLARTTPESTVNVEAALASGRGILLSSCHVGPMFLHVSAFSSRGCIVYAVSAPWFFQTPSPDYWGRRLARWWNEFGARNERLVYSVGGFPVALRLLEEKEMVLVYFDMPGSRRTHFLGKPVMLASGTSQLAFKSGALVLPIRARLVGTRAWTDVAAPIDAREFPDADALHDAVAAVHERWILERPHTLEDPNRPGAWEGGAGAAEWARPARREPATR